MGRLGGGLGRLHVDLETALAAPLEDHDAVREREERVVLAAADVQARGNGRAPLTNEDVPRADLLAAEALHAKPLRLRVASVPRARYAFFVSHLLVLPAPRRGCPGCARA